MAVSERKYIDCRDFPSEKNCTLRIAGSEEEVVTAARAHAVSLHGHPDSAELGEMLRGALRHEPAEASTASPN